MLCWKFEILCYFNVTFFCLGSSRIWKPVWLWKFRLCKICNAVLASSLLQIGCGLWAKSRLFFIYIYTVYKKKASPSKILIKNSFFNYQINFIFLSYSIQRHFCKFTSKDNDFWKFYSYLKKIFLFFFALFRRREFIFPNFNEVQNSFKIFLFALSGYFLIF